MAFKLVVEFKDEAAMRKFVEEAKYGDIISVTPFKDHSTNNVVTGNNFHGVQCNTVQGGIVMDGRGRPHP